MFSSNRKWPDEVEKIKYLSAQGHTLKAIGESYGVSKQRIKQVCQKYKIITVGIKKNSIDKKLRWTKKWGERTDTGLYQAQRAKYRGKKANALRSGIEFTIDFGDIVWNECCPYLNIKIDYFSEGIQENSCSFDRKDINKGYIKDNVIICSWRANRIKNDGTAEEHRLIYEYLKTNVNT
jgi:hypothetical protein